MTDTRALDVLGIKGLADSVRVVTQGAIDGAAAFLSRVCLPAAEELGLALRDRLSHWRAKNAVRMLDRANDIHLSTNPSTTERLSPRLAHVAIEEASWIEDEQVQAMWAGLLASSTSPDGRSDENLLFMNLLKQLSSLQVRILRFAIQESGKKNISSEGLVTCAPSKPIPAAALPALFKEGDLQRIDRELDHLRELGLIGSPELGLGGGIHLATHMAHLTPTTLALHLYVRAQGSKLAPAAYWNLSPAQEDGTTEDVRDSDSGDASS